MKKALVVSAVVATALFANDAEIEALKKEIAALKAQVGEVRQMAAQDNLKFGVDMRSSVDNIRYKMADGSTAKNPDLMANRLWLNMKYQPKSNLSFFGQLSYNKAYGDSINHEQTNTNPGFGNFDWVTNENLGDNTLKVRQAYFLYTGNMGNVGYTASFGRRPSTGGTPTHFREDDVAQSPLSHAINVEFDGASFQFNLDKVTKVPGMYAKLCLGRGLTNAKQRFSMDGTDYSNDKSKGHHSSIDMAGFIFQPYYDGQYRVITQVARGNNLIGYKMNEYMAKPEEPKFHDFGSIDTVTISYVQEGIGEFISDFLDNTKLFASYAMSKTNPESGAKMLGSTKSKVGDSIYVGAQFPAMFTKKGKLGVEYNQGSKYWRSFTYGEDSMIGSKLAARGHAYEGYYTQPLVDDILSFQLRYTYIKYDYTGSNAFFGEDGTPMKLSDPKAAGMGDPVKEAEDIRAYLRYRY